ncbi:MAG: hypothetical protein WBH85_05940 [Thermoanaerobaculia bacterium]
MRRYSHLILLLVLLVVMAGCSNSAAQTDSGGIILSVSDFDGLPISIGVSASGGLVQIGQIDIQSIVRNPTGGSSDLMTVEMRSYEVIFSRADSGSSVPPPLTRGIFGSVPAGGTITYDNLPIMTTDQLLNPPLSTLAATGQDPDTGGPKIILNCRMRFFGRTLSGDAVETAPIIFTIDFLP